MSPFTPYLALPIALSAAWFAGSEWNGSSPGRYRVPAVVKLEEPADVRLERASETISKPDIKVAALLPRVPPVPRDPSPALILHSVMTGAKVNVASINGRLVKEGDSIEGYRVGRIAADGVQLSSDQETRQLRMRALHELPPVATGNQTPGSPVGAAGERGSDSLWANFESPQAQR